jgi:glutathione S-transferase
MITLYGSPKSSAGRCVWCLEEAGVAYENKALDMRTKEHKADWFLKINPNGKVPALVDGDLNLFESMAINFYIAEKYKPELLGKTMSDKALVSQWSFWASSELQNPIIQVFIQKVFMPEDKKDLKVIAENEEMLPELFSVLNQSLNGKKYLCGSEFTLADLNTASVASIAHAIGFNLAQYPNITSWLGAISERPGFQKYMSLRK